MENEETLVIVLLGHVWTPEPCTGSSHSALLELDELKWVQKGDTEGWLCGHMTCVAAQGLVFGLMLSCCHLTKNGFWPQDPTFSFCPVLTNYVKFDIIMTNYDLGGEVGLRKRDPKTSNARYRSLSCCCSPSFTIQLRTGLLEKSISE